MSCVVLATGRVGSASNLDSYRQFMNPIGTKYISTGCRPDKISIGYNMETEPSCFMVFLSVSGNFH